MAAEERPTGALTTQDGAEWRYIMQLAQSAEEHFKLALQDVKQLAARYGNQFGPLCRISDIEMYTRQARRSMNGLASNANLRVVQAREAMRRMQNTPLWLVGRELPDMDTARLDPNYVNHPPPTGAPPSVPLPPPPPPASVQRAPHQTGRMRIVEEWEQSNVQRHHTP